jgi:hypothetical protein
MEKYIKFNLNDLTTYISHVILINQLIIIDKLLLIFD